MNGEIKLSGGFTLLQAFRQDSHISCMVINVGKLMTRGQEMPDLQSISCTAAECHSLLGSTRLYRMATGTCM